MKAFKARVKGLMVYLPALAIIAFLLYAVATVVDLRTGGAGRLPQRKIANEAMLCD